jgi:hypothetical protein
MAKVKRRLRTEAYKNYKEQNNHYFSLRYRHGITIDDYNKMLEQQDGTCAICKSPPQPFGKRKWLRLAVDHNHTTGKIRGLLCPKCNQGIGLLMDNPLFLIRAAEYLRREQNDGEQ